MQMVEKYSNDWRYSKLKTFLIYTAIFLMSLCILLSGILLRYHNVHFLSIYGLPLSFLVLSIVYFILTVISLKKFGHMLSSCGILLSIILAFIDIPLHIIDFRETLVSFPELIGRLLAVGMGYAYVKQSRNRDKILIATGTFCIIIFFSFLGYGYYGNYLNFGSFTGKTEQVVGQPIVFQNVEEEDIALSNFRGQYLVLDFWSSSCGVCFKKFPDVQELYEKYKDHSAVLVYSVFCRMDDRKETIETGVDLLKERGYTFPVLSMEMENPVLKEIGVTAFPTVIIFDPDGKLIFRGNLEYAEKYLNKLIDL